MLYLTDQSLLPQVLVLVLKNCKLAIEPFNPKTGGGVELENGFKIYRRGGFMFTDYNNASLVL